MEKKTRIIHVTNSYHQAGKKRQDQGGGGSRLFEDQQVCPGKLYGLSDAGETDGSHGMSFENQQICPGKLYGLSDAGETDGSHGMPFEDQQVHPGGMFGFADAEKEVSFESNSKGRDSSQKSNSEKQKTEEDKETEKDEKSKEEKKTKARKRSLYSVIGDMLLRDYRLIRDESRNIYYYSAGIYQKADAISFAEFVKRNLEAFYVQQIADPNFYQKLLFDLKSDSRIQVVDRKKLDNRLKYLVAFQNGVYDCLQRRFLDYSPEFYLFSKLEVKYCRNPRADTFEAFLEVVGDGDDAIKDLIWEMIAYILLPSNDGKCFFVMGTAPNSGKSLLAKVIEAMFPDSVVNRSPITSISGRFALAPMADKRINIAPECMDERISVDVVNNIKLLTGEESVNVERKGIDASREYICCKLLFATNCATAFAVKDSAFWNRMRIVPFLHSVTQQNQRSDLFEYLKRELDAIASIAASEFAGTLIESNYRFTVPDSSARLMSQWRNSSLDVLKEFLECRCEITHDPSDFIAVREIYDEYCQWIKDSYEYLQPLALRDFSRKIREKFTQRKEPREKEKIGDEYVRVLHGICRLKDFDAD